MLSSKGKAEFGDKLMPKIQSAIAESVIQTHKGLLGSKHQLLVHGFQELIDRAGHEIAGLWRPLIQPLIDDPNSKMADEMREFLGSIISGDDQWQAIGGALNAISQSGLSMSISNAIAPVTYRLNALGPNLNADPGTYAQAVARGLASLNTGQGVAYENGLGGGNFDMMVELAQTLPDVTTLIEWIRRGYTNTANMKAWLTRIGIPPTLQDNYVNLTRALLSPQDMALAVLRGDTTQAYANEIAEANGINLTDFGILQLNTGEPPGLMQLLEAYRREFINQATLEKGIRQSRVRNEWIPVIEQLRYEPLSTADAIEAAVQGYITAAQAKSYAQQNGLDPNDFETALLAAGEPLSRTEMMQLWRRGYVNEQDVKNAIAQSRTKDAYIDWAVLLKSAPMSTADAIEAYVQGYLTLANATAIAEMNGLRSEDVTPLINTAGEPLSKTEMLTLLRRGVATKTQVENALRQSRLKDAYIPLALELSTQLPSLYEVRALLSSGAITAEQGTTLLLEEGYSPDIVKAIVTSLTGGASAQVKVITEAQITSLYLEEEITAAEYLTELEAIGYNQAEAELIQEVNDWKASITARNQVIAKIKAQYIARHLTVNVASAELDAVQISAAMRDRLLNDWNIEKALTIKLLSESQVANLWKMKLFSPNDPAANTQDALNYFENLGYSSTDALRLLELENKGPLDGTAKTQPVSSKGTVSQTGTGSQTS
jgi:hypothetical protein